MQRTPARLAPDSTTPAKRFAPPRTRQQRQYHDTPHADAMLTVLRTGEAFRDAFAALLAVHGPLTTDGGGRPARGARRHALYYRPFH